MPSNKRLIELDALRAVAILMILFDFGHLDIYVANPTFTYIITTITYHFPLSLFGLSLFIFISGFVLCHNNTAISNRKDAISFLKKRVIRIYPLYWVAIAAFIGLGISYWDKYTTIIQICGAQGLLSPRFGGPVDTLWFIGVILLYYLLYLVFAALSYNTKYMFSAMLGFFFFFAILRLAFSIVEFRFFVYYAIFIAGIIARRYNLLYGRDAKKSSTVYAIFLLIATLAVTSLHRIALVSYVYAELEFTSTPLNVQTVLIITLANALALLFIYASFNIARLSLPLISKTTLKLILAISLSSYCVYLFHRPFLLVITAALGVTHLAALAQNIIILVCGIPLLFLFGYALQVRENSLVRKFIKRG
jgi:peptidoglycan/LPS O-acetylase OafA/YrhL